MATEQATRMLKTYRKKLSNSKDAVELDDLEAEVCGLLKVIRERKDRTRRHTQTHATEEGTYERLKKAKAATETEVDQLAVLLGRANMVESSKASG